VSGALKEAAFSYVLWGGAYETEAVLVNPSNELANIELRLNTTSTSGAVTLPVYPASAVSLKLSELFGAYATGEGDPLVRGSVGMKVTGGSGIVGSVWLRSTDYRIMAALPLETAAAVFTFPQLAQGQGYWTGLSITNTSDTANNVTIEALDAEGRSLGAFSPNLMPGEQRVGLLYEWIPSTIGVTSGRVEIRSSGPLLATEIFGSDTLSFMTAVPGK
jgi:hypothetical protein